MCGWNADELCGVEYDVGNATMGIYQRDKLTRVLATRSLCKRIDTHTEIYAHTHIDINILHTYTQIHVQVGYARKRSLYFYVGRGQNPENQFRHYGPLFNCFLRYGIFILTIFMNS